MKTLLKPTKLPQFAAAMGVLALVLRTLLYLVATDEKGLLLTNHPLELALGVLSAATLTVIVLTVRQLDGSPEHSDNFSAGKGAAFGNLVAAFGFAVAVTTGQPVLSGYLATAWQVLGWLSPVCLGAAAIARGRGKQPFFVLRLVPCLFLVMHIVHHYRLWSGNPQFQDYGIALLAAMSMMFFAFYTAAFDAGVGRRRMQLTMGLTAVYLLLMELAHTDSFWLYLGGVVWAMTDLCSLTPVPKPEPKEENKEE